MVRFICTILLLFFYQPYPDFSSISGTGCNSINLIGIFPTPEAEREPAIDHQDSSEVDDFPLAQGKVGLCTNISIQTLMSAIPGIRGLKAVPPYIPPEIV